MPWTGLKEDLSNFLLELENSDPLAQFSSAQSLSHVQLCDPMDSQHARLPCPSPAPGAQTHVHRVGDPLATCAQPWRPGRVPRISFVSSRLSSATF